MDEEKLALIKESFKEHKTAKLVAEALNLDIKEVAHYIRMGGLKNCRGNCTCNKE